jgi:hypothetical protein
VKRDTQGRCPAGPPGRNIVCMINSIHSHLIARHVQDRIEEATAARTVRAAKPARPREPRLLALRHLLRRRTPLETPAPPLLGDAVTPH